MMSVMDDGEGLSRSWGGEVDWTSQIKRIASSRGIFEEMNIKLRMVRLYGTL
jgi:hypothetical protein